MDRVIKINFWIGIAVAVALLLESAFGIYSFVHSKVQAQSFQRNFSQRMANFNGANNSGNQSSGTNAPQFGNGNFQNGGQRFGGMRMRAIGSQANPIELVIHIFTLILAGAALVMIAIICRFNAKKKKELISKEKLAQE
ncbi:hypothetical protein [Sporolactobacillus laevolacticus]|jgi:hypothetical protein|uniref:Uncharacterized protein n=1 Tax=Sporolactobacillus laevolacticus DSM 442 TaxID=1395513 RepID=V6IW36_9BACL|nr:hypothetical protein [Sporolactobacillus laevolacticus]EST11493.1 hypothetical protein P343_11640 [Sporolactobacillus laevolacticus DSM 442]MDF2909545.1 hypothetical protein [Sporolactobacillus laevolacticus]